MKMYGGKPSGQIANKKRKRHGQKPGVVENDFPDLTLTVPETI